ncbi:isochorismate synthase [Chlorobaculum parvum NCIB 8327]|uniref:Isochorismate synthase MenF n=2 Tax=Chlorobaculum parvum TaxID=274539 RepID=B3QL01_CHLP8|nr:isochorismate synthase [Chlorobaculum parvum NCIB 8327]
MPADDSTLMLQKALQLLEESVKAAIAQPQPPHNDNGRPVLESFTTSIDGSVDGPAWLAERQQFPKLFWMNREKSEWIAGIGEADRIEITETGPNERSFTLLEEALKLKNPHARYVGGFCFNNRQQQDHIWHGFSSALFILPLISLEHRDGKTSMTCSVWLKPEDDRKQALEQLLQTLASLRSEQAVKTPAIPGRTRTAYSPDRAQWIERCETILRKFDEGGLDKVILARQTELSFSGKVPAIRFLLDYPYPENAAYRFYFEPIEGHAFVSFTPERLYRRDGDLLQTEALAGTVTKEKVKADDHTASKLLLASEKDVREHRFVKDTIYRELQPVCSEIDMQEEVGVLQLNRLAHLYARCRARLRPEFRNDSTVLRQLHPTPAVGGVPREEAMELILSVEPFCRGWYAAPVGWLSRDAAEFAVGIRSALIFEDKVYLYSGAGLVRGSDPESEWEEVDQKIGDILAITRQGR